MAVFKRDEGSKSAPTISTASLPDVVYMMLFFFMISSTMREVTVLVENGMPDARTVTKLEKKSLVSNIYIGRPKAEFVGMYGSEPRIQLNDKLATVDDIPAFIAAEQARLAPEDRGRMVVSLKVDGDAPMGLVADVKEALRRAGALNVSYSAREAEADEASAD